MTETNKSVTAQVLQKLQQTSDTAIKLNHSITGLDLSIPQRTDILQNATGDESLIEIVDLLYRFLDTPIVEYPRGKTTVKEIRDVEKIALNLFPKGSPESFAVENILSNNRLSVNTLMIAVNGIDLLTYKLDNPSQKEQIDKIKEHSLAQGFQSNKYKKANLETKYGVMRQLSKAAEMALRVINGEQFTESDFENLKGMAQTEKLRGFTIRAN